MNTITVRVLGFVLSLFVLVTVANQLAHLFDNEFDTETAFLYSSAEKVPFTGVYIRAETVIGNNGYFGGVLSYPCPDGSKIAKDSVVAYVYKDAEAIRINRLIEEAEEEIKLLTEAQNPGITDVVSAKFISSLIAEKYHSVTALAARGDFETLRTERKRFQELLGIYQIITGEETDFNAAIERLRVRVADLESRRSEPVSVIKAEKTGNFLSLADGYERRLSPETLSVIDAELIREIIADENNRGAVVGGAVGKMIDGYEWHFAGIIDTTGLNLKTGGSVRLRFAFTPEMVTAEVADIRRTETAGESLVVLACDRLNVDFVQRRSERAELILDDYEGIRIPREAIRFNRDNEKGVYILVGEKVEFRKIDAIYECDEYLLSQITSDASYISVYDDIIVKGDVPRGENPPFSS
jgi:hypothetical protein